MNVLDRLRFQAQLFSEKRLYEHLGLFPSLCFGERLQRMERRRETVSKMKTTSRQEAASLERLMKNPSLKWALVAVLGLALTAVASGQTIPANATRIDSVVVKLTPFGFSPANITHSPGTFLLFVHNVSGAAPRAINLSGPGVSQPSASQGNYRWFQVLTLAAGSYTLTEANHPAWKCAITIK
jgi:plastocyanin